MKPEKVESKVALRESGAEGLQLERWESKACSQRQLGREGLRQRKWSQEGLAVRESGVKKGLQLEKVELKRFAAREIVSQTEEVGSRRFAARESGVDKVCSPRI